MYGSATTHTPSLRQGEGWHAVVSADNVKNSYEATLALHNNTTFSAEVGGVGEARETCYAAIFLTLVVAIDTVIVGKTVTTRSQVAIVAGHPES